jgi:hypothetical protein
MAGSRARVIVRLGCAPVRGRGLLLEPLSGVGTRDPMTVDQRLVNELIQIADEWRECGFDGNLWQTALLVCRDGLDIEERAALLSEHIADMSIEVARTILAGESHQ